MTINDSHHFTDRRRLWHLLDPRPSVADSGGALPAHRQRHVVRVFSGNATDVRKRRCQRRLRLNHLGRSKVGSEFSFGRSLGSLGSLGTILLFQNFFVLSFQTFFADSQVDLTMGSHYRICVDMDGSRHPQKSIHPFVMKICMKTTPLRVKTQIYLANISNFS